MGDNYKTRTEEVVGRLQQFLADGDETSVCVPRKDLEYLINEYVSIKKLSGIDGLSGLISSTQVFIKFISFYLDLCDKVKKFNREKIIGSFITLDADNFSDGNSIYGHYFMDRVIKVIGQIILGNIRKSDIGARLGGEEFAVIFEIDSIQNAVKKAETIRSQINQYVFGNNYQQTVSGGIYLFEITQNNTWNIDTILDKYEEQFKHCASEEDRHIINNNKNAEIERYILPIFEDARERSDDALYRAKMEGKNKIEFYDMKTDYLKYRFSYSNKGKTYDNDKID